MVDLSFRTQAILVPVLRTLTEDKNLTPEDVLDRLTAWSLFPSDNCLLVTDGVRKFFAHDYIGCLHILAPQFESTVRRAFESKAYATTAIRAGGAQHEETFNTFLQRTDVRLVLGEDLHRVIEMTMVDPLGSNLRNEVAHGLILADKCNEAHCAQVLMLFLVDPFLSMDIE
jgi:hypothetical protein